MITLPSLEMLPGIVHGFFTRAGGVSEGLYAGLNCGMGSSDDPHRVAANRQRAAIRLGIAPDALVTGYQVHSADVAVVERPWSAADTPKVDALVTRMPEIAIGILAADCVPILFADPEAEVIGAAHAGWKGATGGVIEATIARMESLGARRDRLRAAIGPAIQQASYEVGPEFVDRLIGLDRAYEQFTRPAPRIGHFLFDLPGFCEERLRRAGVSRTARSSHDTLTQEALFFSYRRATQRGEPDYGRQISLIALSGRRP